MRCFTLKKVMTSPVPRVALATNQYYVDLFQTKGMNSLVAHVALAANQYCVDLF